MKYDPNKELYVHFIALFFQEAISVIAIKAVQEAALVELLDKVINIWQDCDFILAPYKDQKDVVILGSLEEIIANVDESLVTINTINSSRFVEPIKGIDLCFQSWVSVLLIECVGGQIFTGFEQHADYMLILGSLEEIIANVDESLVTINIINSSCQSKVFVSMSDINRRCLLSECICGQMCCKVVSLLVSKMV